MVPNSGLLSWWPFSVSLYAQSPNTILLHGGEEKKEGIGIYILKLHM